MEVEGDDEHSTQLLETSASPTEKAEKIREELDNLTVWEKVGANDELKALIINAAAKATIDFLEPQKRARRRLSVLDRTELVVQKITNTVSELNGLWDSISMDEERRLARVNTAYGHMESLLSDMVSSEYAMVTAIHDQIEEFTGKVADIRRELGMKQFDMNCHEKGSIALWKALETDMKRLNEERAALIVEQKAVIDRFAHLTSRLGSDLSDETAASLPDTSVLAPRTTVADLRDRCARMEQLLAERVDRLREVQAELQEWTQRMRCDYDENVAAVLEVDGRAPESVLTADLMDQLVEIRETMAAAYKKWLSQRDFEYEEHIVRLHELWDMCCVGESERRLPAEFDPELVDSLEEARSEVDRLEALYERRRDIYEKVAAWRTHWAEKLQFENSENSMDKYTNRGGSLDQRIKYEARLNRQLLPNAVQAVGDAYGQFQREHGGEQVLIEGMEPLAYIQHVTSTHDLEKEMEREQKQEARKLQLLQETKWGTTQPGKTPLLGRRPLGLTASASRMAPVAKLPRVATAAAAAGVGAGDEAASNFTFDQSAISSISPKKRADKLFPKTSSPKGSRATVAPGTRFAPSPAGKGMSSAAATPKRPFSQANKKK